MQTSKNPCPRCRRKRWRMWWAWPMFPTNGLAFAPNRPLVDRKFLEFPGAQRIDECAGCGLVVS